MTTDVYVFLEHYGVLGMKWGIRRDRSGGSRSKTSSTKTDDDKARAKAVQDKLAKHGYTEDRMRRMYGPDTEMTKSGNSKKKPEIDEPWLTDNQKRALMIGGGIALTGLAIYGGMKYKAQLDLLDANHRSLFEAALAREDSPGYQAFQEFMEKHQDTSFTRMSQGWSPAEIANLSEVPVTLSVGSIVKRITTAKETEIRPGGFYAAFKEADVERYKAVLPTYWSEWGLKADSGFITNLKAVKDIKAPSPKETYAIFKSTFDDKINGGVSVRNYLKEAFGVPSSTDDESLARLAFGQASLLWNTDNNELTKSMFARVKAKGYNALVDLNDFGSIADSPMRFLDGSVFSIVANEPLSASAIREAQDAILDLVHSIIHGTVSIFRKLKSLPHKEVM